MQTDSTDRNRGVLGLVLAGGRAQRLGGVDKALVMLGGRPLLAHAIARLQPQCGALALSANGDAARFSAFGAPVVADDITGFAGPLAGLAAGLDFARDQGFDRVVTLAVDTPFAPADLVARLEDARRAAGAEIATAASNGNRHHVVTLWPTSLAADMRRALATGQGGVGRFCAGYRSVAVEWPSAPVDPFFNINAPEDLVAAEAFLHAR